MTSRAARSAADGARAVHLLMVHGVGRHDPLSSLLHVYQSFRANLRSPEAPVVFEDRIPDWRLDAVNEDGAPPFLKLVPRFADNAEDIAAVYVYEVNYSNLAGIVRHNHRLDLTTLFVGFDMAVSVARQRLTQPRPTLNVGDPFRLARLLQRMSGLLVAATVPVLGVPSVLLRNYTETLVADFTRFFEDIATFALDKNGEQLIAAHLDRTIENIVRSDQFEQSGHSPRSEFVIAAHSLGSVVVHNYLVRKWTSDADADCVPDRLLTFGSPIGLITWLWLFLDFPHLAYDPEAPTGSNYFCWSASSHAGRPAKPLMWVNAVNGLDPVASAFPLAAADLSRPPDEVRRSLAGGRVFHRFCGGTTASSTGAAHTRYLHDRKGFVEILLRLVDLRQDDPLQVECPAPDVHWRASAATLGRLSRLLWLAALAAAAAYCGLVAWKYQDPRVMATTVLYAFPRATIWGLAFWQRLFYGGPTKRTPDEKIAALAWGDITTFVYRLRRLAGPLFGARREVDPERAPRAIAARAVQLLSFAPTIAAMMLPVVAGGALAGELPNPFVFIGWHLSAFLVFTLYLILCALCELVTTWRAVLDEIAPGTSDTARGGTPSSF